MIISRRVLFGIVLGCSVLGFAGGSLFNDAWIDKSNTTDLNDGKFRDDEFIFRIERNGILIEAGNLIEMHRLNPNNFNRYVKGQRFTVEGQILSLKEFSEIDKISGFHVPLKIPPMQWYYAASGNEEDEKYRNPPVSISLFVKELSDLEISSFQVGQKIEVQCTGLRIIWDDLIFDNCRKLNGSKQ